MAAATLASPRAAASGEPCIVVVSDFARGDEGVSSVASDRAAASAEVGVRQVLTEMGVPCRLRSRDQTRILVRAARPICSGESCLGPILDALDGDLVLSGTVENRESGGFVARIRILDRTGHVLEARDEVVWSVDQLETAAAQMASTLVHDALARRYGTRVSFRSEVGGVRVVVGTDSHDVPADVWVLPDQPVTLTSRSDEFRLSTRELQDRRASGAVVTVRDHRVAGIVVKTGLTLALTVAGGVLARVYWKTDPADPKLTVEDQQVLHAVIGLGAGFLVGILVAVPLGNAVARPTVDVQRASLPSLTLTPAGLGVKSSTFSVALGPGGLSGTFY
jgi:hypothetical protein